MKRFKTIDRRTTIRLLKTITHLGALIPLGLIIWDFQWGQLGVDPVREITLRTGRSTLVLLVLTLAVTPVNIVLGWKSLLPLRRLMGLYAFLYVSLHLLTFLWLDYVFNWPQILDAIVDQRYVLVGFAAFLLMVPLAASSNKWAMRLLGKRWKPLHRAIYVIAVLGIIHYFWLVKNVYTKPIIYGLIVAVLLLMRAKSFKYKALRWRRRMLGRRINHAASAD